MLNEFIKKLELRRPVMGLVQDNPDIFSHGADGRIFMSDSGFEGLLKFLEKGEPSSYPIALQAGVRWAVGAQRIELRRYLNSHGVRTWACLWAMRRLRSGDDILVREYAASDICFIQILLLKEMDFCKAAPFLIERFIIKRGADDDLRSMAMLALMRLLDQGVAPETIKELQVRYPRVTALSGWRPGIPGKDLQLNIPQSRGQVDFHQMVRSVQDMKSFSSLTRTVYLISLFHVPLNRREWSSLLLTKTDHQYFAKLIQAGALETCEQGVIMSSSPSIKRTINDFLFESYGLAKETAQRNEEAKRREVREKKVKNSELDRQALAMLPDGVICVQDGSGLYYMNPAAEKTIGEDSILKRGLFGPAPMEKALAGYSPSRVKEQLKSCFDADEANGEIFGDRITFISGEKRYDITLGQKVILIRDTTDQRLIDEEIGKLYRHEMRAALDVLAAGLESAMISVRRGQMEESLKCLEQVENKRSDLVGMLKERIDFIRLHSDSFRIKPVQVNLNLVIEKVVERYREKAAAKGVVIRSNHMEVDPTLVKGEERFLQRAIDNVARNAIKFTAENSEINISMDFSNREVSIEIKDSGPGIPKENLRRIFGLGYTTNGAGRGLYLAKRIIAAHGGSISATSEPGQGALFRLTIPLERGEMYDRSDISAHSR